MIAAAVSADETTALWHRHLVAIAAEHGHHAWIEDGQLHARCTYSVTLPSGAVEFEERVETIPARLSAVMIWLGY